MPRLTLQSVPSQVHRAPEFFHPKLHLDLEFCLDVSSNFAIACDPESCVSCVLRCSRHLCFFSGFIFLLDVSSNSAARFCLPLVFMGLWDIAVQPLW